MEEKRVMMFILQNSEGHISVYNNILQLTDAPDIVTDGDGDKYIGYEEIGEAYSGCSRDRIDEKNVQIAEHIASVTKGGVFLDLGCGDGAVTVPCAQLGVRIIAGDISNKMMMLLQERARKNDVSLENVTLCRMNALDIPLKNESVDAVVDALSLVRSTVTARIATRSSREQANGVTVIETTSDREIVTTTVIPNA